MAFSLLSKPRGNVTGAPKRGAASGRRAASPQAGFEQTARRPAFAAFTAFPATQIIQKKLKVGEPNDIYEQEADRVAEEVMRIPDSMALGSPEVRPQDSDSTCGAVPSLQRMCTKCAEEDERLQRLPSNLPAPPHISAIDAPLKPQLTELPVETNGTDFIADANLEQAIHGARGSGMPLPVAARVFLQPRFGRDLTGIRIHTDCASGEMARRLQSRAFTVGSDIFFASGEFEPHSKKGLSMLSHELTHTVQQGAVPQAGLARVAGPRIMRGVGGAVQREVEPESISESSAVLARIRKIGDSYSDVDEKLGSAVANMARLAKLGKEFDPGVPGKAGPTNAFVYTCRCGWVDMGHFSISAAIAYLAAYLQQIELRVEGVPQTPEGLLSRGLDKIKPELELLLHTVPGAQGKEMVSRVRALLKTGDPRDISLALGYGTEFYQQAIKLIADQMESPPKALRGEQFSAFTIEDLPSDAYGAAFGRNVWQRVGHEKINSSPVYGMMEEFFRNCKAVYPIGRTRCDMMAETTPGSCRMEGGKEVWSKEGIPIQYTSTTPYLLSSARPLCGNAKTLQPESGPGALVLKLPSVRVDISAKGKSLTLTLLKDQFLYQPRERGYFTREQRIPGRSERIDPTAPVTLAAPTLLRINDKGAIVAYSTLKGVPSLGDIQLFAQFNPATGSLSGQAIAGVLEVDVSAKLHFDYKGLFTEILDLASPETKRIQAILESKEFKALVTQFLEGKIGNKELYSRAKTLLQEEFPQGFKTVGIAVLDRLMTQLKDELLPLYTGVKGRGKLKAFGLPVSYFTVSKGSGRESPLWGTEIGLLASDIPGKKLAVGGKIWLYGEDILQARASAGFDLLSRKGFAEISGENKTLTGRELNLGLRSEVSLKGEWQIFLSVGGQHEIGGSK